MNTSLLKNTLPILITSAAKPNDPNSVKLTSFELRRDYTINALKKWQEISPKSSIIICDGSNYCFEKYCKLRNINTNKIEFLSFENQKPLALVTKYQILLIIHHTLFGYQYYYL